ncbi:PREDICTED: odorant receptor Or2-like [Vollenhovia emeryi]|uniref:odorant receptor Or2-like n=1 Tax=Vollenhovia emeryi TaxID=411798 RepID=UPI0005F4D596|nr:PREDICTED: odorant receptor Or2-like [Vollenhovia emeryi]
MDSSKELAYTDLDWAIGINRISLKILGLWPDEKLSRRQKFLADFRAFVIFTTMFWVSVLPGLLALLRVWGDMLAMTDNMQIGLPFSITVMKFVIMWLRKKELEPIVSMIVEDWLRTKTTQERDTMIRQARFARMMVVFGCVMMSFASAILIIPPIFGYTTRYLTNLTDPGRPMLVQTYYLRDITETPYYEIVIAAQASTILVAAISYTGIDTFLGLLVFHICAQLEILKERMINLDNFKDFSTGLAFTIKDHLRLIRSVDVIDNTFNLMLLALLVYFAMLFCLQGFLIVTIIDGDAGEVSFMRICWLVSILINTFAHMCLYCVVGEILIAKAEAIFYAVYNYTWYLRTPNEAKKLMMIMMRAEKPLYITAGKMFPMTLSLFCSLIKTSAGYISVLLANR